MDEYRWMWMNVDEYGWTWMNIDEYGWTWMNADECGGIWMKMDACGWILMKMDEHGWIWMNMAVSRTARYRIDLVVLGSMARRYTHQPLECDSTPSSRRPMRDPNNLSHLKGGGHVGKWWSGWFGTFFPYIGNNHPNWLIFFRGVAIPPTRMFLLKWSCLPRGRPCSVVWSDATFCPIATSFFGSEGKIHYWFNMI